MALWFPINVNNLWIGQVELVRIAPVDRIPKQDEPCTYKLKYYDRGHPLNPKVEAQMDFPYQERNPIPLLTAALMIIGKENDA